MHLAGQARVSGVPVAYVGKTPNTNRQQGYRKGDAFFLPGSEAIGSIVNNSNAQGDQILTVASSSTVGGFPVAPANFTGPMQLYAQLFEKYEFTKLQATFKTSTSTTTTGSFVMYFETDPDTVYQAGTSGYQAAMAHKTKVVSNMYQGNARCNYRKPQGDGTTSFFTSDDLSSTAKLTTQAVFRCVMENPCATNATLGTVYLSYLCKFYVPQFEPQASSNSGVASSYLSTTSTTAGTLLTEGDWNLTNGQPSGTNPSSPMSFGLNLPLVATYIVELWMSFVSNGSSGTNMNFVVTKTAGTGIASVNATIDTTNPVPSVGGQVQIYWRGVVVTNAVNAVLTVVTLNNVGQGGATWRASNSVPLMFTAFPTTTVPKLNQDKPLEGLGFRFKKWGVRKLTTTETELKDKVEILQKQLNDMQVALQRLGLSGSIKRNPRTPPVAEPAFSSDEEDVVSVVNDGVDKPVVKRPAPIGYRTNKDGSIQKLV